MLTMAEA